MILRFTNRKKTFLFFNFAIGLKDPVTKKGYLVVSPPQRVNGIKKFKGLEIIQRGGDKYHA